MQPNSTMENLQNIDYGDLAHDADFVNRYDQLKESLMEVQDVLDTLLPLREHYHKMDLAQRIEYDIYLAYTMNSYYWVNLRILGIDPTTTPIKDELNRTKAAMMKFKEINDKVNRPKMDLAAARRFITHGLNLNGDAKNQKIKFIDED